MSARSFFDTNVLVYMADKDEPDKQQRALSLLTGTVLDVSGGATLAR